MSTHRLVLVVACALIDAHNRVLLARRPQGKAMAGLWEFPGGKAEQGETPEETLVRELHEELGVAVVPENLVPLSFASHSYEDFHLLMPLYTCRHFAALPVAREGQSLAWVKSGDLADYAMPAADIPLIAPLRAELDKL